MTATTPTRTGDELENFDLYAGQDEATRAAGYAAAEAWLRRWNELHEESGEILPA